MGRTDSRHLSFSAGSGWSCSVAPRRKKARMGPFRNLAPGDGEIWAHPILGRRGRDRVAAKSAPQPIDVRLATITHLMAREPRRFQGLHGFSLTISDSGKPGSCFRSTSNSGGFSRWGSDTVLAQLE